MVARPFLEGYNLFRMKYSPAARLIGRSIKRRVARFALDDVVEIVYRIWSDLSRIVMVIATPYFVAGASSDGSFKRALLGFRRNVLETKAVENLIYVFGIRILSTAVGTRPPVTHSAV